MAAGLTATCESVGRKPGGHAAILPAAMAVRKLRASGARDQVVFGHEGRSYPPISRVILPPLPLADQRVETKSPESRTALRAPEPHSNLPATRPMISADIMPIAAAAMVAVPIIAVVPTVMTPIAMAGITRCDVDRRPVRQRSGPVDYHGWRAIHRRTDDHGRTGRSDHDGRMETHGRSE